MSKIKNRDQIDDSMQLGYTFEMKNDYVGACTEWGKTWKYIVSAMDTGHYNSIEDFDEDFDGTQCVFNWASDYEMELNNAMMDDRSFAQIRIDYCTEYLKRVDDTDGLNCINMRRAIAETYFWLGMKDKGENEFEKITEEYPTSGWAWIGWADQYSDIGDYDRAIKLLTHALEIDGIEDIPDIKSRLQDVYKACGMNDEADSIVISEKDFGGIPLSEINNVATYAKNTIDEFTNEIFKTPVRKEKVAAPSTVKAVKIPRNAPCPCGSGRKYKQCCGKNK